MSDRTYAAQPAELSETDAAGAVTLDIDGVIARIVVSSPARRNAMSAEMMASMRDLCRSLVGREDVRVVVFAGAGETFIAGADIVALSSGADSEPTLAEVDELLVELLEAIDELAQPTIAAVNGAARGAGVAIAVAADLRVARADASFGIPAAKLGVAYPVCAVARLAEVAGSSEAARMLLTGAVLAADEARRCGMVQVVADDAAAEVSTLAESLSQNSPLSMSAAKLALRARGAADPSSVEHVRAQAAVRAAQASEDLQEGVRAFRERRRPVFIGR